MFANYVQKKTIRSEKTAELYRNHVRLWAKSRGFSEPDDVVQEIRDKNLDPYTVLQEWVNLLHSKGRAPKTIISYFTAVKGFLLDSDIDIRSEKLKSKVVLPEAYEVSTDRAPTREELKRLLLRSSLQLRTAVTVLVSSGLRLGELTKLAVSDVTFGETCQPSLIKPKAGNTKTRRKRRTFCSAEATDLLREYLGERIRDPNARIFGCSGDALYGQLMRVLVICGLRTKSDESSMRYELHPHCFRKFFFTSMIGVGIDRGIVEGFMGHAFGLDQSYLLKTDDELRALYVKGMPNLTILTGNGSVTVLRDQGVEIAKLRKDIDFLLTRVEAAESKQFDPSLRREDFDKQMAANIAENRRRRGALSEDQERKIVEAESE